MNSTERSPCGCAEINDNNVIVGIYFSNAGPSGLLLYNIATGVWTDLNFPYPYDNMTPIGISNSGVIALEASPSGGLVIATPTGN
jgi:hypothetical protein